MNRRLLVSGALARTAGVALLCLMPCGRTALAGGETATTNAEIAHLLSFIRTSGCDFLRNGSWHAPQDAHDHILKKLNYIRDRDTLRDAEQFIELAATRSSLTGRAYQVRCPGAPLQECSRWLLDELVRFRKSGASR